MALTVHDYTPAASAKLWRYINRLIIICALRGEFTHRSQLRGLNLWLAQSAQMNLKWDLRKWAVGRG